MTSDQPVNSSWMPTSRPITHSPEAGHCASDHHAEDQRQDTARGFSPSRRTRTRSAMMILKMPSTTRNTARAAASAAAPSSGLNSSSPPTTRYKTALNSPEQKALPVLRHEGMNGFGDAADHQKPAEHHLKGDTATTGAPIANTPKMIMRMPNAKAIPVPAQRFHRLILPP